MNVTKALPLSAVKVLGGFWRNRIDNIVHEVIPYQWKALNDQIPEAEPSHAIENFRIASGKSKGRFYGLIFQDSDVGKWIEAASYSLIDAPNPELETILDQAIELVEASQEPNGYIDTYFSVAAPERKWSDFAMGHEMYCGGHLIEGAIAYYQATGKSTFLNVMRRYADHLCDRFGAPPLKQIAFCGHPEIELALFKLYEATDERRYLELAKFFIDERGRHPEVLDNSRVIDWGGGGPDLNPWHQKDYYLDHAPVRDQAHADGHAVRAMYLYSGMADQWRLTGDPRLEAALERLWSSATDRRMYITGGLGSQGVCERFTIDYDLPSDTAYAETCAAIGLIFWAWRMTLASGERRYADVLERALYNGALSGISLDGTRYFYVNPLEVVPSVARARKDHEHVKPERVQWFGCACCPPNIARLICSIGQFLYSHRDHKIWIHHFVTSVATLDSPAGVWKIEQTSQYPWEGVATIRLVQTPSGDDPFELAVRVPDSASAEAKINGDPSPMTFDRGGYACFRRNWRSGDTLELRFPLATRILRAHPLARELTGRIAIQRGPLVYCAEEIDNGPNLHLLRVDPTDPFREEFVDGLPGVRKLIGRGRRVVVDPERPLYADAAHSEKACEVALVPYFAWGNRGRGEMAVWMNPV